MRIELWAKKLNGGHVKIGDVDVPEGLGYEFLLPVKTPIGVMPSSPDLSQPMLAYRTFRYTPSAVGKIDETRRYLEE